MIKINGSLKTTCLMRIFNEIKNPKTSASKRAILMAEWKRREQIALAAFHTN